jgi:hypothetical protein
MLSGFSGIQGHRLESPAGKELQVAALVHGNRVIAAEISSTDKLEEL